MGKSRDTQIAFFPCQLLTSTPVSNHIDEAATVLLGRQGEKVSAGPCNAAVLVGRMGMFSLQPATPDGECHPPVACMRWIHVGLKQPAMMQGGVSAECTEMHNRKTPDSWPSSRACPQS